MHLSNLCKIGLTLVISMHDYIWHVLNITFCLIPAFMFYICLLNIATFCFMTFYRTSMVSWPWRFSQCQSSTREPTPVPPLTPRAKSHAPLTSTSWALSERPALSLTSHLSSWPHWVTFQSQQERKWCSLVLQRATPCHTSNGESTILSYYVLSLDFCVNASYNFSMHKLYHVQ